MNRAVGLIAFRLLRLFVQFFYSSTCRWRPAPPFHNGEIHSGEDSYTERSVVGPPPSYRQRFYHPPKGRTSQSSAPTGAPSHLTHDSSQVLYCLPADITHLHGGQWDMAKMDTAVMFHLPAWIIPGSCPLVLVGSECPILKESEAIRTKSTGRAWAVKGYIWAQQHAY